MITFNGYNLFLPLSFKEMGFWAIDCCSPPTSKNDKKINLKIALIYFPNGNKSYYFLFHTYLTSSEISGGISSIWLSERLRMLKLRSSSNSHGIFCRLLLSRQTAPSFGNLQDRILNLFLVFYDFLKVS